MRTGRTANISTWFPALLPRFVLLVAALLLGFLFHRIFFESGLAGAVWQLLVGAARTTYERIGLVSLGLFPLSLYLAALAVFVLLEHLDLWLLRSNPRGKLRLVQELGPMLGVTGTMISLSQAMGRLTMSQGVELAINQMSSLVAQALGSSIWGVVLAMVAFLLRFLCPRDEVV